MALLMPLEGHAAGCRLTAECSAPLKTYESLMKLANEIVRSRNTYQYLDADFCLLDNEWDVQSKSGHQQASVQQFVARFGRLAHLQLKNSSPLARERCFDEAHDRYPKSHSC